VHRPSGADEDGKRQARQGAADADAFGAGLGQLAAVMAGSSQPVTTLNGRCTAPVTARTSARLRSPGAYSTSAPASS